MGLRTCPHSLGQKVQTVQKPLKEEAGSRHSPVGVLTKVRPATHLPFSVNNRTKGSVSHCITFLTISKGFRGGSQMHSSRQWALPIPLPQEGCVLCAGFSGKVFRHCTRGSRWGSLGTAGGDTPGPLPPTPPRAVPAPWLLLPATQLVAGSGGGLELPGVI